MRSTLIALSLIALSANAAPALTRVDTRITLAPSVSMLMGEARESYRGGFGGALGFEYAIRPAVAMTVSLGVMLWDEVDERVTYARPARGASARGEGVAVIPIQIGARYHLDRVDANGLWAELQAGSYSYTYTGGGEREDWFGSFGVSPSIGYRLIDDYFSTDISLYYAITGREDFLGLRASFGIRAPGSP